MDLKNQKELLKLIALCRKNGINSIKSGDFELKFDSSSLFPESAYKKKKAESAVGSSYLEPQGIDEDDLLFYSSTPIMPTAEESSH